MLNREKHQLVMGQILRDVFVDISVAPLLGLKGGTCAYFFYGLPRFSADLDFDLFISDNIKDKKAVFEKILKILAKYGKVKDSRVKRNTIFALLSYGPLDHNIKVEINTREPLIIIKDRYELKEYLGISMFAAKKDYLFAGKLAALILRSEMAMRDVYDIYYFAKNNWDIDAEALKVMTGKDLKEYLKGCIAIVEKIKSSQVLRGLGEFLNQKEKSWVKNHLQTETIFLLKNYLSVLK